ncbi:MAG: DUF2911 domain-containing protein [Rhodothermia bacterium]|nr:DUF2911 domain-containing protein [Rhodothermia bacterium]
MLARLLPRTFVIASISLLMMAPESEAQDLHPSRRLSPVGIAQTHIGDTYVKLTYGRPYIRGRDIFGANNDSTTYLVPFGEIWRTGANESTEMTVSDAVLVAGNRLEAGTYSIFTEPGPTEWVIHISPQVGLDGTGIFNEETNVFTPNVYQPENDVFVVRSAVSTLPEDVTVDPFTITLEDSEGGAEMVLSWERTEVRVPITNP